MGLWSVCRSTSPFPHLGWPGSNANISNFINILEGEKYLRLSVLLPCKCHLDLLATVSLKQELNYFHSTFLNLKVTAISKIIVQFLNN